MMMMKEAVKLLWRGLELTLVSLGLLIFVVSMLPAMALNPDAGLRLAQMAEDLQADWAEWEKRRERWQRAYQNPQARNGNKKETP